MKNIRLSLYIIIITFVLTAFTTLQAQKPSLNQTELADTITNNPPDTVALLFQQPDSLDTLIVDEGMVKRNLNKIYYNPKTSRFPQFLRNCHQLIETKQGRVNIVNIGGSHVQAGTYIHQFRTRLLTTHPDLIANRGLIFPYALAKTNNPPDYKTSYSGTWTPVRNVHKVLEQPLGCTGIAAYTSDTLAQFTITLRDSLLHYDITEVHLLCHSNSDNIIPTIVVNNYEFMPYLIDTKLHRISYAIPPTNDTLTVLVNLHNPTDTFCLSGVYLENFNNGFCIESIGVNGASVPSYLKCERLADDLSLLSPDLILFGIGINDAAAPNFDAATFKQNYLNLIDHFRRENPQCTFLFITNNDSFKKISRRKSIPNRNALDVKQVMYELAEETGGAVWDLFEIMGGLGSMKRWNADGYAQRDKIHFTKIGYQLLGNLLFEAIQDAYNQTIIDDNRELR